MKKEFKVIADLLPNNTRVLDVGCGDGALMDFLVKEKNIEVRGLELNQDNVQECIYKGLPVIQGNAETELYQFPKQSFDYVRSFDRTDDGAILRCFTCSIESHAACIKRPEVIRDGMSPLCNFVRWILMES